MPQDPPCASHHTPGMWSRHPCRTPLLRGRWHAKQYVAWYARALMLSSGTAPCRAGRSRASHLPPPGRRPAQAPGDAVNHDVESMAADGDATLLLVLICLPGPDKQGPPGTPPVRARECVRRAQRRLVDGPFPVLALGLGLACLSWHSPRAPRPVHRQQQPQPQRGARQQCAREQR